MRAGFAGSAGRITAGVPDPAATPRRPPDAESRAWLADLRATGAAREAAVARLHALLLKAARFEVARRGRISPHLRGGDLDDVAHQAAGDAVVSVLARLDDFRGESRFTTWAYKFALYEAAVRVRRLGWQGREVPPADPDAMLRFADHGVTPHESMVGRDMLRALRDAMGSALTPHQREVFTLLALNGVPIDVLADRLGTTRGALYKALHDARRRLRADLARRGFTIGTEGDAHD